MSEEQWRNDGPDIYARKAPDESLFDDDMALIGPVGVVSYLNRQEATIAQQQARIEELEAEVRDAVTHNGCVFESAYERLQADVAVIEQALAAERERAREYKAQADKLEADYLAARAKLQAERERADSLEASVYSWQDDYEKLTAAFEECAAALQAEREKSARLETQLTDAITHDGCVFEAAYGRLQKDTERLEALAGLATEMAAYFHKSTDWASFPFENWLARYDAIATQAPEAK